ncbi:MAG: hypothetical protein WCT42_00835 [Candidatus Paceibacterota bacterium]
MKEQYSQFQKKLEEIPQLKPEAHFVINDSAQKILNNSPLNKIEQDSIDAIFIELEELDKDIVSYLINLKSKGIITNDECNLIASYFTASKQIGPDSGVIRDAFYGKTVSQGEFEELMKKVSIPEYSSSIILNVYKKIIEKNNKI